MQVVLTKEERDILYEKLAKKYTRESLERLFVHKDNALAWDKLAELEERVRILEKKREGK